MNWVRIQYRYNDECHNSNEITSSAVILKFYFHFQYLNDLEPDAYFSTLVSWDVICILHQLVSISVVIYRWMWFLLHVKFLMSLRKQDRLMKGMDSYCTKNTCTTLLKHNARWFQVQVKFQTVSNLCWCMLINLVNSVVWHLASDAGVSGSIPGPAHKRPLL